MATVETKVQVIDSDAHVIEGEHTWNYLLPHEERYRPQLFASSDNPMHAYWVIDGKIAGHRNPVMTEDQLKETSAKVGRDVVSTRASRELTAVSERLRHMDHLGIDVQVLHNTMWIQPVTNRAEVDIALCGSWNRWMADVYRQSEGRLRYCAVMPTLDIDACVEQVRFAKQNGAAAIAMRPFEAGRTIVDATFYPIYEEAEKVGLGVAVHIANGSPQALQLLSSPFDRSGGFSRFRAPTVIECEVLMMSEVPERFPRLRWAFVEASANWVPWIVREVQQRFLARGRGPAPENVLKHFNVFVTCEISDDIEYVVRHAGDENLLLGTDYGHADISSAMNSIQDFKRIDALSDVTKRRILFENPKRMYAI